MLLLLFVASGAVIWVAGVKLSAYTDVVADRLHLGEALGGLVLLAVATNLPELAITVSAAASGQVGVAVGNILGGIAIQTVVLVALDAFGVRGDRPLTYVAGSLTLVLEAALVVAVLAVVVGGAQLPASLTVWRIEPATVLIAALWLIGLKLISGRGSRLPWHEGGEAPHGQEQPRGHSQHRNVQKATDAGTSTTMALTVFATAAVATLVAGVILERSGEQFFGDLGLSGVLFGSTVLAAATSLPELSTGLAAVRQGDAKLAMGDIFGGNAFLPVLFVLVPAISGKAVLPAAQASDIYLTALAALLTSVYLAGLIFRPHERRWRLGVDSRGVLVLYVVGLIGLVLLT